MSQGTTSAQVLLAPTVRVLNWTRASLALHAVVINVLRLPDVAHPGALIAATAVIVVWALVLTVLDDVPARWGRACLVADIVICITLTLLTKTVIGEAELSSTGFIALPVYWQATAPLMASLTWGARGGLLVGVAIALASVSQSRLDDPHVWATGSVIALAAWVTGGMVDQLRHTIAERDHSIATAVALSERDRMSRIVHDGALQVLSMIEREGRTMGPQGQRLAQLARQQEIALRSVLQDRTVPNPGPEVGAWDLDLVSLLDAMSSERVTVSTMAGQVLLPRHTATEIEAAVAQIVLNSELHAGPEAQVWILLEEGDGQIIVSVRDNGVGMTRDQVKAAFDSGRLGIRESIVGRIRDLGGTAEVTSLPGRGVEWELQVPTSSDHPR